MVKGAKVEPFPLMTDRQIEAVIEQGRKHPWAKRQEDGWSYYTDVFDYIEKIYGKFIGKGLTRAIIKRADLALYVQMIRNIGRLPARLDIPIGAEARLRAITDPTERNVVETVRAYQRNLKRQARARKRDQ
jgi:hypothetical protein